MATQLPLDPVARHDALWRRLQQALAAGDVETVNACGRNMRFLVPTLRGERDALVNRPIGEASPAAEIARYDELTRVLRLHP